MTADQMLVQITAIDGDGVVYAPLINTMSGKIYDPARRVGHDTLDLRLVPTPPPAHQRRRLSRRAG